MSVENYYEVLGLAPGADGAMVDQAYWHNARKYQSMAAADPRAQHDLDHLNEAYGVLGTPRLRQQYDASLRVVAGGRKKAGARTKKAKAPAAAERPSRSGIAAVVGASVRIVGRGLSSLHITKSHSPREAALDSAAMPEPDRQRVRKERARPSPPSKSHTNAGDSAEDVQAATAAMVSRWRSNAAAGKSPDTTLVEIFQSEHDVATDGEPLSAVIDILRGARNGAEVR